MPGLPGIVISWLESPLNAPISRAVSRNIVGTYFVAGRQ
jgi:hypothetical protein